MQRPCPQQSPLVLGASHLSLHSLSHPPQRNSEGACLQCHRDFEAQVGAVPCIPPFCENLFLQSAKRV